MSTARHLSPFTEALGEHDHCTLEQADVCPVTQSQAALVLSRLIQDRTGQNMLQGPYADALCKPTQLLQSGQSLACMCHIMPGVEANVY